MTILVCGTARSSANQIETHCDFCGGTIFHRPNAAPGARKMCLSCSIPNRPTRRPIMDDLHHLLHRATQRLDALWHDAEIEVTPRQWAVLTAAAADDRCSQSALIDATGLDRSTMTDVTKALAKRGYISRYRDRSDAGDARTQICRIKAAGRALLEAKTPAVRRAEDELLRTFGSDDENALRSLLEAIAGDAGHKASGKRGLHRATVGGAGAPVVPRASGATWAPEAPTTKMDGATP